MEHPDKEALIAFTEGRLSNTKIDAIANHLESCNACQQQVEQIEERDSSIVLRLREDNGVIHPLPEACAKKLILAGKGLHTDDSDPVGRAKPAAVPTHPRADAPGQSTSTHPNEAATAQTLPHSSSTETIDGGEEGVPRGGERFGDYVILKEIGRGGMGVVYRARQISLNRPVALKKILESQRVSVELLRRFRTEAEAAARLNHPGIVPVFEIGQVRGQHFFSMGLFEQGSLKDLLTKGPVAPSRAANLVRRISRTVQFAHSRNIVHRDLKPANVLLDEHGNPKLTDFGLAKDVESDSQLTSDGQVMGTPSYMAPEQAAGRSEQVGPLSDVYALGAILFHLVADRPPFVKKNIIETLHAVIHEDPTSPQQFNKEVDIDLATICLKCLEKDPARRYPSAAELADDLDHYLCGEPIEARRISRTERFGRWCRRNPRAMWGTLATIAVMASAVVYAAIALSNEVEKYEQWVANSLHLTAPWVAKLAEQKLEDSFREVSAAAESPDLKRTLGDLVRDEAVYAKVKSELARHDGAVNPDGEPLPLPRALRPLQSWLSNDRRWEMEGVPTVRAQKSTRVALAWWICGPHGVQLSRDPWLASTNRDFGHRSYFTGLNADAPSGVHPEHVWKQNDTPRLSAVFMTEESDYWVVAVSAPVWDDDGNFVGVVGMFLQLGSLLKQPKNEGMGGYAVLLDPRPDGQSAKVLEHPHYETKQSGHLPKDVGMIEIPREEWEAPIGKDPFFPGEWHTAWEYVRLPNDAGKLIALVRVSTESGSENLQRLGLAIVGLLILPLITLLVLLPDRRRPNRFVDRDSD